MYSRSDDPYSSSGRSGLEEAAYIPECHNENKGLVRAWLSAYWQKAWAVDGFLFNRWKELNVSAQTGWNGSARWVKCLILALIVSISVTIVNACTKILVVAFSIVDSRSSVDGLDSSGGIWVAVHRPIQFYLEQHSDDLGIDVLSLHVFWCLLGFAGVVGGFFGSSGARIVWLLWGVGSVAMVWEASASGGRIFAAGLAVSLWSLSGIAALRGLNRKPIVHNYFESGPFGERQPVLVE
ncbi:hypothetical protein [Streptomyces sp. NPDC090112]|uniref:hypothetical protein n=1 Tax=Streptomyces sp. NPDC090112 TaxID=3365949 RepID=UPI003806B7B3